MPLDELKPIFLAF